MIINSKEWSLITQEVRMNKGKLVNIQISPGRYVKMYESDAIAKGLLKAKPQPANKMRVPSQNKAAPEEKPEVPPEVKPPADDFMTIPGIGKATARALETHGITTFEQLRSAGTLVYLSDKMNKVIESWRNG
jgi:predicted flap endonuclease-1-like 5' DNA nuclease